MRQCVIDNYSLKDYEKEYNLLLESLIQESEQIVHLYGQKFNPYPIEVDEKFIQEAVLLQSVLIKSVEHIVNNYFKDLDIQSKILLPDTEKELLRIVGNQKYIVGTIRPDFIIDINNTLKICEINARFCFNGFVLSNYLTNYFCKRNLKLARLSHYFGKNIIAIIANYFVSDKPLRIIKASEKGYDIHFIKHELKKYPYEIDIDIILPEMLTLKNGKLYANDIACDQFILELHQHELLTIPSSILHYLIEKTTYINDIRTILIAHDKRLLSVLCDAKIMSKYISLAEVELLQKHIAFTTTIDKESKTYISSNPDIWVIKKSRSGKGDGVYFGRDVTSELLTSVLNEPTKFYVAQHYIKQKKFEILSLVESDRLQVVEKYLVGLIMSFNHTIFGIGFFRAGNKSIVNASGGGEIIAGQCS